MIRCLWNRVLAYITVAVFFATIHPFCWTLGSFFQSPAVYPYQNQEDESGDALVYSARRVCTKYRSSSTAYFARQWNLCRDLCCEQLAGPLVLPHAKT